MSFKGEKWEKDSPGLVPKLEGRETSYHIYWGEKKKHESRKECSRLPILFRKGGKRTIFTLGGGGGKKARGRRSTTDVSSTSKKRGEGGFSSCRKGGERGT